MRGRDAGRLGEAEGGREGDRGRAEGGREGGRVPRDVDGGYYAIDPCYHYPGQFRAATGGGLWEGEGGEGEGGEGGREGGREGGGGWRWEVYHVVYQVHGDHLAFDVGQGREGGRERGREGGRGEGSVFFVSVFSALALSRSSFLLSSLPPSLPPSLLASSFCRSVQSIRTTHRYSSSPSLPPSLPLSPRSSFPAGSSTCPSSPSSERSNGPTPNSITT